MLGVQQSIHVQTNPGVQAGPIGELASGGEAARIMLALLLQALRLHNLQPWYLMRWIVESVADLGVLLGKHWLY